MSDYISKQAILKHIEKIRQDAQMMDDIRESSIIMRGMDIGEAAVKCLSCGHHIAERPSEAYCNIMCKWVSEEGFCTMFEPRTHGVQVSER